VVGTRLVGKLGKLTSAGEAVGGVKSAASIDIKIAADPNDPLRPFPPLFDDGTLLILDP
jgi:hypothetical protein